MNTMSQIQTVNKMSIDFLLNKEYETENVRVIENKVIQSVINPTPIKTKYFDDNISQKVFLISEPNLIKWKICFSNFIVRFIEYQEEMYVYAQDVVRHVKRDTSKHRVQITPRYLKGEIKIINRGKKFQHFPLVKNAIKFIKSNMYQIITPVSNRQYSTSLEVKNTSTCFSVLTTDKLDQYPCISELLWLLKIV